MKATSPRAIQIAKESTEYWTSATSAIWPCIDAGSARGARQRGQAVRAGCCDARDIGGVGWGEGGPWVGVSPLGKTSPFPGDDPCFPSPSGDSYLFSLSLWLPPLFPSTPFYPSLLLTPLFCSPFSGSSLSLSLTGRLSSSHLPYVIPLPLFPFC